MLSINEAHQADDSIIGLLVSSASDAMLVVDAASVIISLNQACERLLGYLRADILGKPLSHIFLGPIRGENAQAHDLAPIRERRRGATHRVISAVRADGRHILLEAAFSTLQADGITLHTFILRDVTARMAKDEESYANAQRLQILNDLAPIGIFQIDLQWNCTYVNNEFCRISGQNPEEASGHGWISAVLREDRRTMVDDLNNALLSGSEYVGEFRFQTPLGHVTWVHCSARPIFWAEGSTIGYLGICSDVTDKHQAEQNLRFLAHYDSLTHLANRSLFNDRLRQACLRAERDADLALIFLDLDGFKLVNDNLGHDAGDALLKIAAERIVSCVRREDTVARLGGDEFTVILEGIVNGTQVAHIAEKIVKALKHPFTLAQQTVYISASVGIAMGAGADRDPTTLTKQADIAMYRAKDQGRNNSQFFTPELNDTIQSRLALNSDLHRAAEDHQLSLVYQPQVCARSGAVVGYEALLRWHHPERGEIAPSEFVPVLEESGLILPVGDWIIQESVHALRKFIGTSVMVGINISPRQFRGRNLVRQIREAIDNSGAHPEQICIEVTESLLFDEQSSARKALTELRDMGVMLALDDFGTGYSSLSYLKQFPINCVKIDRSFIHQVTTNSDDAVITDAIIGLARALKLLVVAEGVDSQAKYNYLRERGCDILQGYHISKPMPLDSFPAPGLVT
jgi:diguanylate cyclase (GGDEF)-like protein/PAS domain S-box-containing protein